MRLYLIEWKRLLANKLLILLVVLFLFGNCMFYYYSQSKEHAFIIENKTVILQMEAEYRKLDYERAQSQLSNQLEQLLQYRTILMAWQFSELEHLQQDASRILELSPNLASHLRESIYLENSTVLNEEVLLIETLLDQYNAHKRYFSYLSEIIVNAETLNKVSIFQDSLSFSNRNIDQTVKDYDHLYTISLDTGIEHGITSSTQYRLTDLLIIVLLLFAATLLFQYEKDKGLYKLLRITKHGRATYIITKLLVLLSFAIITTLVFYASIIYMAQWIFGFGNLDRYIQSMSSFLTSNLLLTIKQYFGLFILLKVFIILFVSFIISLFFVYFTSISKIFMALVIFFGGSFLLYTYIPPLSHLNVFRFINVFEFLDTYRLLVNYYNLNLFQYPQNRLLITYIVLIASLILLPIMITYCYANSYFNPKPSIFKKYWQFLIVKLSSWTSTITLLSHETHKVFIQNKGFVWIILSLLFSYNYLQMDEVRFNQEDAFYNQYLQTYTGVLTEDKEEQLQADYNKFNNLPLQYAQLQEAYLNKEIPLEQYNIELAKLDVFSMKKKAFTRVYVQYEHLQKLQLEKGITGSFINEVSSKKLFESRTRDQLNGMIYCFLLLLAIASIFTYEYKNNVVPIVRSTKRGRVSLFAAKYYIATLYVLMLHIILYSPQYINVLKWYPTIDWLGAIQSIVAFEHIQLQISLDSFVIMTHIFQLIGSVLMAWGILSISILVRRHYFTILAATLLIIMPMLIELLGFTYIRQYSLNVIFNLYHNFSMEGSTVYYLTYITVLIILVAVVTFVAWLMFSYSSYLWRRKQHAIIDEQSNQIVSSEK